MLDLPPQLAKLDADDCYLLQSVSVDSNGVKGNIFEFIFTNCRRLNFITKKDIAKYYLTKIQLYSKELHNQVRSIISSHLIDSFYLSPILKLMTFL